MMVLADGETHSELEGCRIVVARDDGAPGEIPLDEFEVLYEFGAAPPELLRRDAGGLG